MKILVEWLVMKCIDDLNSMRIERKFVKKIERLFSMRKGIFSRWISFESKRRFSSITINISNSTETVYLFWCLQNRVWIPLEMADCCFFSFFFVFCSPLLFASIVFSFIDKNIPRSRISFFCADSWLLLSKFHHRRKWPSPIEKTFSQHLTFRNFYLSSHPQILFFFFFLRKKSFLSVNLFVWMANEQDKLNIDAIIQRLLECKMIECMTFRLTRIVLFSSWS